ncbi:hypothetical protein V2A60_008251 [Cordyceps javanica]
MTSFATAHQLPLSLDRDRVLSVLHDATLLPRILWPNSVLSDRRQTLSGLEGVLSDGGVSVSLFKLTDGVTCAEKVGGFTMTVSYSIADGEAHWQGRDKPRCLRLQEERSVRTFKPIASFIRFNSESPVKTQHLLRFFEAFGENGGNATLALESIAAAESKGGKPKVS